MVINIVLNVVRQKNHLFLILVLMVICGKNAPEWDGVATVNTLTLVGKIGTLLKRVIAVVNIGPVGFLDIKLYVRRMATR